MYKKVIKRGEKEYTYYYTNVRKEGKVKNIFLSSDKKEAIELEKNLKDKAFKKTFTKKESLAKKSFNFRENLLQITPQPEKRFEYGGAKPILIFLGILILSGLFFYSFSDITGFAVVDNNIELEIEKYVGLDSTVFLTVGLEEYNKPISDYDFEIVNDSYYVDSLSVDVSSFGIELGEGTHTLFLSLVDDGELVAIKSQDIVVEEPIVEENITEEDVIEEVVEEITLQNETNVTLQIEEEAPNVTLQMELLEKAPAKEIEKEETIVFKERIVVGQPVTWIRTIRLNGSLDNLTIEIPKEAKKLKVRKIENNVKIDILAKVKVVDNGEIKPIESTNLITGLVVGENSFENNKKSIWFKGMIGWFNQNLWNFGVSKTGGFVYEGITGFMTFEEYPNVTLQIDLLEEVSAKDKIIEIEIEYETPGPYSVEIGNEEDKRVTIGSEIEGYIDILAFTTLSSCDNVVVHWVNENRDIDYDCNEGLVEWNVPHLSEQTFNVYIGEGFIYTQSRGNLTGGAWINTVDELNYRDFTVARTNSTLYLDYANKSNDGELVYTWYKNNIKILGESGDSLSSDNFMKGDLISAGILDRSASVGLVAYWDFDEGSGNIINDTIGGNDGECNSGANTCPNWTDSWNNKGAKHKALVFDGGDDYINTSSDFIGTGADSISAWIYLRGWGSHANGLGRIVDNGKTIFLVNKDFAGNVNSLRFVSDGVTVVETLDNSLSLGVWYHVAVTRDATGANTNLYINGVLSGDSNQNSGTPTSGLTSVAIGKSGVTDILYFNGTIDEVAIFNRVLSSSEILDLYDYGVQAFSEDRYIIDTTIGDYSNGTFIFSNQTYQEGNITLDFNENNLVDTVLLIHFDSNYTQDFNLTDDVSIYDNNGVCTSSTTCPEFNSSGYIGGAFEFDGIDDFINIDGVLNNLVSTTTGTWSAWVKPVDGTPAGTERIIGFGDKNANNQITFRVLADGELDSISYPTSYNWQLTTDNAVFADNTWTHIALVQDGVSPVLYVDSVAVAQTFGDETNKAGWFASHSNMDTGRIGNIRNSGVESGFFDGEIDEVRIWKRALSAEEVRREYQKNLKLIPPSLNNFEHNATFTSSIFDLGKNPNMSKISWGQDTPHSSYYYQDNLIFGWDGSNLINYVNTSMTLSAGGGLLVGNNGSIFPDNNATSFDSINDNINIGVISELSDTTKFTISLWMNQNEVSVRSANPFTTLKNNNERILIHPTAGGFINFYISNGAEGSNGRFPYVDNGYSAGEWVHIVMAYDGDGSTNADRLKAYMDGEEQTLSFTGTIPSITADLSGTTSYIGSYSNYANWFNGTIDEVHIWDRALSSDEIQRMYNISKVKYPISLQTKMGHYYDNGDEDVIFGWHGDSVKDYIGGLSLTENGGLTVGNSEGFLGGGTEFDGVGDYFESSFNDITGYPFTFTGWFKTTTTGVVIMSYNDRSLGDVYQTIEIAGSKLAIVSRDSTRVIASSSQDVNDGKWHFFAGVFTSNTIRTIYLDNFDGVTNTDNVGFNANIDNLVIGRLRFTGSENFFNGPIDEVHIYDRALSSTEVTELYTSYLNWGDWVGPNGTTVDYYINQTQDINSTYNGTARYIQYRALFETLDTNKTLVLTDVVLQQTDFKLKIFGSQPVNNHTLDFMIGGKNTTVPMFNITNVSWLDWGYDDVIGDKDLVYYNDFEDNYLGRNATAVYSDSCEGAGGKCPINITGKVRNGLLFDGVDDYIEIQDDSSLNPGGNDFSISAWIKVPDLVLVRTIVSKGTIGNYPLYLFYIGGNGLLQTYMEGTGDQTPNAMSSSGVDDNLWHHVVLTVDRTNSLFAFYIDGVNDGGTGLDFSGTSVGDINPSQSFKIGRYSNNPYEFYFNGTIDEVLIYSRVLTSSEISNLYDKGRLVFELEVTDDTSTVISLNSTEWEYNITTLGDGNYTWRTRLFSDINLADEIYENRYSDWSSSSYFILDTVGPNFTLVQELYNTTGLELVNITPIKRGENITFRVNLTDLDAGVSSVWLVIYKTAAKLVEWFSGFMTLIAGTIYQGIWGIDVNLTGAPNGTVYYDIHVNDTLNQNVTYFGDFNYTWAPTIEFTTIYDRDEYNGREFTVARTNSTLYCYNGTVNDNDNDQLSNRYKWYKNDVEISGEVSSSLGSSNFMRGDSIYCNIQAFDNSGMNSTWVNSTIRRIIDTILGDYSNGTNNFANLTYQEGNITLDFNENNLVDTVLLMHFDSNFTQDYNLTDDVSIYDNNGYCINMTSCPEFNSSGFMGGAFEFDGNDYFNVTNEPYFDITDEITLSFWVKLNQLGLNSFVRKSVDNRATPFEVYSISMGAGDTIVFDLDITGSNSADRLISYYPYVVNEWYHMVGTYDGTDMKFYLNGELNGTTNQPGSIQTSNEHVIIGAYRGTEQFLNGAIDELRIWNRSLSAEEILREYQKNLKLIQPTLNNFEHNATFTSSIFDLGKNPNMSKISWGQDTPHSSYYYQDNLIFGWDGSIKDAYVGGFTGTLGGGLLVGNNESIFPDNNATTFDGDDDYIDYGNGATMDALNVFTISFWTYHRGAGGANFGRVLYKANWFEVIEDADSGDIRFFANAWDTTGIWSFARTLNEWTYYTITYDYSSTANDPVVYKNGEVISINEDVIPVGTVGVDGSNLLIGGRLDFARAWDGDIDEVHIWDRTLSSDEIQRMYNISKVKYPISLQTKMGHYYDNGDENVIFGWHGDSVKDYIGGLVGTENGGLTVGNSEGFLGGGTDFDGVNDNVDVGDDSSMDGLISFSVSAWVKSDTTGIRDSIISKWWDNSNRAWELGTDWAGEKWQFQVSIDGSDPPKAVSTVNRIAGQWYHLVGVRTSTQTLLYINGDLENSIDLSGTTQFNGAHVTIGAQPRDNSGTTYTDYFEGAIDEVHIYDRALSAGEIAELYTSYLNWGDWVGAKGLIDGIYVNSSYYTNSMGELINSTYNGTARYIQYRALFETLDTNKTLVLTDVVLQQTDFKLKIFNSQPFSNFSLLQLLNYTNISDATPTFNITNFTDLDDITGLNNLSWNLEIDNDSDFSSLTQSYYNLTLDNFTIPTALSDDTYYWRARLNDSLVKEDEIYENYFSDWSGVWSFLIDTAAPNFTLVQELYNTTGLELVNITPITRGENITFRVNLTDYVGVSSVWLVIYQTAAKLVEWFSGFMTLIAGTIYQGIWGIDVNLTGAPNGTVYYTIFANDTLNNTVTYAGDFNYTWAPTIEFTTIYNIDEYNGREFTVARTNSTLYCYNGTVNDNDNDQLSNRYKWYKNDIEIFGEVSSSLGSSNFMRGDSIYCNIQAYDNSGMNSTWVNSTVRRIIDTILGDYSNGTFIFSNQTYQEGNITLDFNENNLIDTLLLLHFDSNFTQDFNLTDDVSIYDNNGVCTSMATCPEFNSSGYIGGAFEFDGVDDYIDLGNPASLDFDAGTQDFSIFAWVFVEELGRTQVIIDERDADGDGWDLRLRFDNKFELELDVLGIMSIAITQTNKWYYIGATVDRDGNGQIYLDGYTDGSVVAINSEAMSTSSNYVMGKSLIAGGRFFNGAIDEVRIYNRTLTAEEIRREYQKNLKKIQPTLNNFEHNATFTSSIFDLGKNPNMSKISWGQDTPHSSYYYQDNLIFGWDGAVNYSYSNTSIQGTPSGGMSLGEFGNNESIFPDNNATYFNGTVYLDYGDILDPLTKDFTTSAWVNVRDYGRYNVIVSKSSGNNGFNLMVEKTTGNIRIRLGGIAGNLGTDVIPLNTWKHVVVVFDRDGNAIGYIDGSEVGTLDISGQSASIDVGDTLKIGLTGDQYFNGSIDEVHIWDRALSSDEIQRMYNISKVKYPISLQTKMGHYYDNGDEDVIFGWHGDSVKDYIGGLSLTENGVNVNNIEGYLGGGTEFDGNSYLTMGDPSSLDISGAFTMGGWINVRNDVSGWLVHKGGYSANDGAGIFFGSSADKFQFKGQGIGGNDFSFNADSAINFNQWYYVVGVHTGSAQYLYVDGVQQSSTGSATDNFMDLNVDVEIGGDSVFNYNLYGAIDEVHIYDRALSSTEITTLYNNYLNWGDWVGAKGLIDGTYVNSSYYTNSTGELINSTYNGTDARYIQYRALFETLDTNETLVLTDVSLEQEDFKIKIFADEPVGNHSLDFMIGGKNTTVPMFNITNVSWLDWGYDDVIGDKDLVYYNDFEDNYLGRNATAVYSDSCEGAGGKCPINITGKVRNGLLFDGVNDYINISSADDELPSGNNPRTINLWFKFENFDTDPIFLQYGTGNAGERIIFKYRTASDFLGVDFALQRFGILTASANNIIQSKVWHMITMVIPVGADQTDDLLMYVDGVSQAVGADAGDAQTLNTVVGGFSSQIGVLDGTIDEVLIYSRALTSSEISNLYDKGRLVFELEVTNDTSTVISLNSTEWEYNITTLGDGNYTWRTRLFSDINLADEIYENRYSDWISSSYFILDTAAPNFTLVQELYNTTGLELVNITPITRGENITFRVNLTDYVGVSSVWLVIYQTAAKLVEWFSGFMTLIAGTIYQGIWGIDVNLTGAPNGTVYYTIFANDTLNNTVTYAGDFNYTWAPTIEFTTIYNIDEYNGREFTVARTNSTLYCYNGTVNDNDNDQLSNRYKWYKNDVEISGEVSSSLGSSNFMRGDSIYCNIQAYDNSGMNSTWVNSTIRRIIDTILGDYSNGTFIFSNQTYQEGNITLDFDENNFDDTILLLHFDSNFTQDFNLTDDVSIYDNNGFCTSSTTCPEFNSFGYIGGAFEFDGVDDYVSITTGTGLGAFIGNGAFTISAWVNSNDVTSRQIISGDWSSVGGAESHNFEIRDSPNNFEFGVVTNNGDWEVLGGTLSNNQWYHVIGTYNGDNEIILYVDGINVGSDNTITGTLTGGNGWSIGRAGDLDGLYFNGKIDEFRIWNRSLSAEEIRREYQKNLKLIQPTLNNFEHNATFTSSIFDLGKNPNMSKISWGQDTPHSSYYYQDNLIFGWDGSNLINYVNTSMTLSAGGGLLVGNNGSIFPDNNATSFDGGDDFVDMGNSIDPSGKTAYSFSVWIKSTAGATSDGIMGWFDGSDGIFMQSHQSQEGFLVAVGSGNDWGQINFETSDDWVHAILVYDGSLSGNANRLKFYANGVLRTLVFGGSANIPANIPSISSNLTIGKPGNLIRFWDGLIDEAHIWDRALSSDEIQRMYNISKVKYPISLQTKMGHYYDNGDEDVIFGWHGDSLKDYIGGLSLTENGGLTVGNSEGFLGGGTEFDGSDDYINIGDVNDLKFQVTDSFTISTWINPALDSSDDLIFGYGWVAKGYHLRITSGNKFRFILIDDGGNNFCGDSSVLSSGWHHVVGVFDGSTAKTYVDGILDYETGCESGTATDIVGISDIRIGSNADSGGQNFDGKIDEVHIYDKALSAGEVTELYNNYLNWGEWVGAKGLIDGTYVNSSYYTNSTGELINSTYNGTARYIQYRALFETLDTNVTPVLTDVSLEQEDFKINIYDSEPYSNYSLLYLADNTWTTDNHTYLNWTTNQTDEDLDALYSWIQIYNSTNSLVINATLFNQTKVQVGDTSYLADDHSVVLLLDFDSNFSVTNWENQTNDKSVYGNNGVCTSMATCPEFNASGKVGGGFEFDGSVDRFNVNDDSSINFGIGDFSTSVWIKTSPSSRRGIFNKFESNDGWYLDVLSDGKLRFALENEGGIYRFRDSAIVVNDGEWHYVNIIWDGSSDIINLYVDGVLSQGGQSNNGDFQNSDVSANLIIGLGHTSSGYFNGALDEFRIWNRALSAEEIRSMYELENDTLIDGNYSWKVRTRDNATINDDVYENIYSDWSETFNFQIDTTAPNVTIQNITVNRSIGEVIINESSPIITGENITLRFNLTDIVPGINIISSAWVKIWQTVKDGVMIFFGWLTQVAGDLWEITLPAVNYTYLPGQLNYTIYVNDTLNNTFEYDSDFYVEYNTTMDAFFNYYTVEYGENVSLIVNYNLTNGSVVSGAEINITINNVYYSASYDSTIGYYYNYSIPFYDLNPGTYIVNINGSKAWYSDATNFTWLIIEDTIAPNVTSMNATLKDFSDNTVEYYNITKINVTIKDRYDINGSIVQIQTPNSEYYNISLIKNGDEYYTYYNVSSNVTQLGTFNLMFFVNDSEGNINDTETYSFEVVDTTKPQNVTILLPANSTITTNRTPLFTWDGSDDPFLKNYSVYIDDDVGFGSVDKIFTTINQENSQYQVLGAEQLGADTKYYWKVYSCDNSSNCNNSHVFEYTTDNTKPIVSLNSPADNYWTQNTETTFTYTPSDTNLDWCILYANWTSGTWNYNSTDTSPTNVNQNTLTADKITDGYYDWNVICVDAAGNNNTLITNRSFGVDLNNPQINLTVSPTPLEFGFENTTINFTITDTFLNYYVINITYPNGTYLINTTGNFTIFEENLTKLGNYTVIAYAKDNSGRVNNTYDNITVRDTIEPLILINYPENNSILSLTQINFSFNVSDLHSIRSVNLTIDGIYNNSIYFGFNNLDEINYINVTGLPDQINSLWNISVYDNSSNLNISETRIITIDNTYPLIDLNYPEDNFWINVSNVMFNYTLTDNNNESCMLYGNWSNEWKVNQTILTPFTGAVANFSFVYLDSGNYLWGVYCNDTANNLNWSMNYTIHVDLSLPNIILVNQTVNRTIGEVILNESGVVVTGENVTLRFTLTDVGSGINAAWVKVWQTVRDGVMIFFGYLVNTVDDLWEITIPAVNYTYLPGQINYTLYTNDSTGSIVYYDGNFSVEYNTTLDASFNYYTVEYGENVSLIVNYNLTNNSVVFDTVVNITIDNVNYSMSYESNIGYYYNDTLPYYDIPNLSTHRIEVFASRQYYSNLSNITWLTIQDTIAPNVTSMNATLTDLVSGINFTDNAIEYYNFTKINITILDRHSINKTIVQIQTPNSTYFNISLVKNGDEYYVNYNVSSNVTQLGTFNIEFWINDNSSNWNSSETYSFEVVDKTKPLLELNYPENKTFFNVYAVNFSYNISDWHSIFECNLSLDNSVGGVNFTNTNNTMGIPLYFNVTNMPDGNYDWNITCSDISSNLNISETRMVTIDTIKPNISYVNRTPETVYPPTNITINATIDDIFLQEIWIEGNWSGSWKNYTNSSNSFLINSVTKTYSYNVSAGNFSNQQSVRYRWWANDSAGNIINSSWFEFKVQNRLPPISIWRYPLFNTHMLYDNFTIFDWDDSIDYDADEVSYELEMYNNTFFNSTYFVFAFNDSISNYTLLANSMPPVGNYYIRYRANDSVGYNEYNYTNLTISYATLNITTPSYDQILRKQNTYVFNVSEVGNGDWVKNISLKIAGATFTNYLNLTLQGVQGDFNSYLNNYTIPNVVSQYVDITAYAWNGSIGDSSSSSDESVFRITIPNVVSTTTPSISYFCPEITYRNSNEQFNITVRSTMESLMVDDVNVSIVTPSGDTIILNQTGNNIYDYISNIYSYEHNFTYIPTVNGNYELRVEVRDINFYDTGIITNTTAPLYVKSDTSIAFTSSGISNFTVKDICSNRVIKYSNASLSIEEPAGQYHLEFEEDKVKMLMSNVTLDGNEGEICVFNDLGEDVNPPTDTRAVDQFNASCYNLDFGWTDMSPSVNITYNYTDVLSSITHEESLSFYKCRSASSCSWIEQNYTIFSDLNKIEASTFNFSLFMVSEDVTITIVTITTSGTGGGGGGSAGGTRARVDLDIIEQSTFMVGNIMEFDNIFFVKNPGTETLFGISLSVFTDDESIKFKLSEDYIFSLAPGQQVPITLNVKRTGDLEERDFFIDITANVVSPLMRDVSRMIISPLGGGLDTEALEQMGFAERLFIANPACMDLRELVEKARDSFDEGDYETSVKLAQGAVEACNRILKELGLRMRQAPRGKILTDNVILGIEILVFLFVFYGIYNYYRRRRFKKK